MHSSTWGHPKIKGSFGLESNVTTLPIPLHRSAPRAEAQGKRIYISGLLRVEPTAARRGVSRLRTKLHEFCTEEDQFAKGGRRYKSGKERAHTER